MAARELHQSVFPHIGRQRPFLWILHGGLVTFGILSQNQSRSWSCILGLGWALAFLTEPATLGNVGMNTFPELGASDVGKTQELVADTFRSLI
jgi:hypothetical protein